MRILQKTKDGGSESPVDAYFLIEIKSLFSIAILKFNKGGRENYHSHAFDAWTWFLTGELLEERIIDNTKQYNRYFRSLLPKFTPKDNLHRVKAFKDSWCLTIRGKWKNTWTEYNEKEDKTITFTHNRKIIPD